MHVREGLDVSFGHIKKGLGTADVYLWNVYVISVLHTLLDAQM